MRFSLAKIKKYRAGNQEVIERLQHDLWREAQEMKEMDSS